MPQSWGDLFRCTVWSRVRARHTPPLRGTCPGGRHGSHVWTAESRHRHRRPIPGVGPYRRHPRGHRS